MERYIRVLLFGILMMLMTINKADAASVATSFQLPLANYPTNDGCLEWGGYNSAFPGQLHVADDACATSGTDVLAVANGIVKFAGPYKNCSNWGYLIIVEHTLTDGSVVNSIYGHIAPIDGISAGVEVSKGQHIGDIVHMTCWSDHIHFGIYDGPYSEISCSYNSSTGSGSCNAHGYLSDWPGNYLDPTDFIESHQLDCSTYQSEYDAIKADYGSFIGNAEGDPYLYDSVCAQGYDNSGTSSGTSAILFDVTNEARQAYLVRSGFWTHYSNVCGGPTGDCADSAEVNECGAPIGNEYYNGINTANGYGTARQDFQTCYLYWNGSVASSEFYPEVAPGWFDQGWNGNISYAFAESYEENGARNTLGEATDIVDGAAVHHWGNDSNLPYVQDFDGGSYGWSVIMYNEDMDQAFMITGDIWDTYNNQGPDYYGPPCDDLHEITGGAIQYFEYGIMKWNGSTGAVSVNTNPSGCSSYSVSSISEQELDWDWDGYSEAEGDCDDTADHVNPSEPELWDNVDNDCDGLIDEAFDLDGDGWSYDQGDCDETRNGINPYAVEIADGLDNDCDGVIDESDDNDYDGWTVEEGDCDDTADHVNPGTPEQWDSVDNDCDGLIDEAFDLDGDGWSYDAGDCSEQTNGLNPGMADLPDGIDNDCDGLTDNTQLMYFNDLETWELAINNPTPQVEDFSSITSSYLGTYLPPATHFNGFTISTTYGYTGHTGVQLAFVGMVCATETREPSNLTAFTIWFDDPTYTVGLETYSMVASLRIVGYRNGVPIISDLLPPDAFIGLVAPTAIDTLVLQTQTAYDGICLEAISYPLPD